MKLPECFSITDLRNLYITGKITPDEVISVVHERIKRDRHNPIWIHVIDDATISAYIKRIQSLDKLQYPLWGIPFAIKDNIDLAGQTTTAACQAFSYTPTQTATVVKKLIDAGAIPIGKTNLDQFATGLSGTRSPYGIVHNSRVKEYISGGSSSGSAVAVACGHVAFALGTDTAGSGRVPASLNNLVGLKPSRGLLSTSGVVPACRTIDCVSLFAHTLDDAELLLNITKGYDPLDHYSCDIELPGSLPVQPVIGVPSGQQLEFFGHDESKKLFYESVHTAREKGAAIVEMNFAPFIETAKMLYQGPWVVERWLTAQHILQQRPNALLPVIRQILEPAAAITAADMFKNLYRLAELKQACHIELKPLHAVMTPTLARPWTIQEMLEQPIERNTQLGYYTNFMNLLDLSAIAIPGSPFSSGLPNGMTLFADRGNDLRLIDIARRITRDR